MDALKWLLLFVWLCINADQPEASSWTITLPSSVKGFPGSCVVIPCTFNYPDSRNPSKYTGIWTNAKSHVIYHPVASKIEQEYHSRTEMVGDVTNKNCSLKIESLRQSDKGPFYFRIEMAGFNNYSYRDRGVSIIMTDKLNIAVSVETDLVVDQTVRASCSVSLSCPTSPPVFTWSHSGVEHFHSMQFDVDHWKATASLSFRPTKADHNKPLVCTVRYNGGQQQEKSKPLTVKHAPVNVQVMYKLEVKEGESVQLRCSSDAHPPASSYEWFDETSTQLHQGNIYMISNVSRHVGAFYCAAINTVGRGSSSPVQLSVLYAPEIKTSRSSCSAERDTVTCVCTVESRPPSEVQFALTQGVLPGTKLERNGSVTTGTVRAKFGSSEFILCLANNTEGSANLTLPITVKGKMLILYTAIPIGAGAILVILLLSVGFAKKCRGTSGDAAPPHLGANKVVEEAPVWSKRKEVIYSNMQYPANDFSDHVYGNIETCTDDAIYGNV